MSLGIRLTPRPNSIVEMSEMPKSGNAPRKKPYEGAQAPYCLPIPLSTERIEGDGGECITKLTFGPPCTLPVVHSADQLFASAGECPELLIDPMVWFVIKPWIKNQPAEIDAFWRAFNTPEAARERMRAVGGTRKVTWQKERALIPMVHATRRLLAQADESTTTPGIFPLSTVFLCSLGEWVMNAVENDHEAPRRLYELLKDSTAADDKTNRSLINRDVFKVFAQAVANNRKLPTKKSVREKAYIANDLSGLATASRAFRELGLAGLPEGLVEDLPEG